MELFHNLIFGFGVALSWQNLLYCTIGVSLGLTAVSVAVFVWALGLPYPLITGLG